MAQAQVEGRRYSVPDQQYTDLCGAESIHWRLAIGGDSHARNISRKMRSIMGYGSYKGGVRLNIGFDNFAQGGLLAMEYERSDLFHQLRECSARIVLLHMGGNDLDMITRRERGDVVLDLLELFVELEQHGKIVYVVGVPNRHSKRNLEVEDLATMQNNIKFINKKLKEILIGRFIALPPPCFPIASFAVTARGERVHFRDDIYTVATKHILERLNMDLSGVHTPPSKIEKRVNKFINTHSGRN